MPVFCRQLDERAFQINPLVLVIVNVKCILVLSILFTQKWIHKCLVTKESITRPIWKHPFTSFLNVNIIIDNIIIVIRLTTILMA